MPYLPDCLSYQTEKQVIVQTTNPTKSAAAILKKLDITKPKLDFAHFEWRTPALWWSGPGPEDGLIGNELEGVVEREDDAAERCGVGPSIAMGPAKYTHAIAFTDGLEARDWRACRFKDKRITTTAIFDDHAAATAVVEPLDAGDEIVVFEHRRGG